jgi:hypothetical protein
VVEAAEAIELIARDGVAGAMNVVNSRAPSPQQP